MYSTVQYSTVQYSTVYVCTVQYSTVQYTYVQYSTVQYSTVQYSTVQYSIYIYSTVHIRGYNQYCIILIHYYATQHHYCAISPLLHNVSMTRPTVNSTSRRTDFANTSSYSELSKVLPFDIFTECRKLSILSIAFFFGLLSPEGSLTSVGRFWKALVKRVSSEKPERH